MAIICQIVQKINSLFLIPLQRMIHISESETPLRPNYNRLFRFAAVISSSDFISDGVQRTAHGL
ncbi:MAG: hypothetical protein EA359_18895 [Balneolaceae bacterium]|nr:MAG: hypothetical protein EA359_18895 [Balneolaceae bacterium]